MAYRTPADKSVQTKRCCSELVIKTRSGDVDDVITVTVTKPFSAAHVADCVSMVHESIETWVKQGFIKTWNGDNTKLLIVPWTVVTSIECTFPDFPEGLRE